MRPSFLEIKMEQLARKLALVTHPWRGGLEQREPMQAVAAQEARDGGLGKRALPGDLEAWQAQAAQREHHGDLRERRLLWAVEWS